MEKKTTDLSLVAQTILGNNKAFEALVVRYQSPIRRFFLHHTHFNHSLSDDLAQETFIKAYTNIRSFKSLSSFSSWLYRIAYNTLYDYFRSQKPTEEITDTMSVHTEEPSIQSDRTMDVHQAIARLKGDEKTCILLYYMEDLEVAKIAEVMNCPAGTVKSHLSRGREKLSNYLTQSGYGDNDRQAN